MILGRLLGEYGHSNDGLNDDPSMTTYYQVEHSPAFIARMYGYHPEKCGADRWPITNEAIPKIAVGCHSTLPAIAALDWIQRGSCYAIVMFIIGLS